jgi:membrane protein YdbS with pleckstrin-like domain
VAVATAGITRDPLRPPRNLVSRKAIAYWAVRAGLGWALFAGLQILWLALDHSARQTHVTVLVLTLICAVAHVGVMPVWRFRVHRWEATEDAVYLQVGWFNQDRRIAPVSRIQTVDSHRGPFEQIFGLAKVTVTTASAAGPLTISGLDRTTAEHLVDSLTATTQATTGDAT